MTAVLTAVGPGKAGIAKADDTKADGPGQLIRASVMMPIFQFLHDHVDAVERVMQRHFDFDVRTCDPYMLIPLSSFVRFFEGVARETNTSTLGLKLGHSGGMLETLGPVGLIFSRSPTLRFGFAKMVSFLNIWQTATRISLKCDGEIAIFEYQILDHTIWPRRQDAEFTISVTSRLIREVFDPSWRPLEVEFEHEAGASQKSYFDTLKCPVSFGHATNRIIFRAGDLDTKIRGHDPAFLVMIERYVRDMQEDMGKREGFFDKLLWYIENNINNESLSAVTIARAFGMSVRSLQRRVEQENLSLRTLIKRIRLIAAASLLVERKIPLGNVPSMVGYSDTTTLWRALKSWTGRVPSELTEADLQWMIKHRHD